MYISVCLLPEMLLRPCAGKRLLTVKTSTCLAMCAFSIHYMQTKVMPALCQVSWQPSMHCRWTDALMMLRSALQQLWGRRL